MDAARMREMELPILEHQKVALEQSIAALEAARSGGTRELRSTLRYDLEARRAMMDLKGSERAAQLVAGMDREHQASLDPNVRTERLVSRWNRLEQAQAKLRGFEHTEAREKIEARMRAVAAEIGRDTQVESTLRQKQQVLGIGPDSHLGRAIRTSGASIGRSLEASIGRSVRERGHDLSM